MYHDPDRRSVAERRAQPREISWQGPREPGRPWVVILFFAAMLFGCDAVVWHGHYRHALMISFSAKAEAARDWSDHLWSL